MYRIRFHGRGGQGIKTAGRVLGTAFFLEGFEVQDAPRYGAERRGAPIFAYVRAARKTINERGIITRPDLIIVADDSLFSVPAAGVLAGAQEHTVLLISSDEKPETWKERINFGGSVVALPSAGEVKDRTELQYTGATAGVAARLLGVISSDTLKQAIMDELAPLGDVVAEKNARKALEAFDRVSDHAGCVTEGKDITAISYVPPDWVEVPFEDARVSAPAIHAAATSVEVKTGLWRMLCPVLDRARCKRCWYMCTTFCPDSAMSVTKEGYPEIDYDHCKGCMICYARCHNHAIEAVPEHTVASRGGKS
ncbi:MAG: 2-oxoacid:acceptor oxidoreductase family protein [Betaproteobacteria bacterium]